MTPVGGFGQLHAKKVTGHLRSVLKLKFNFIPGHMNTSAIRRLSKQTQSRVWFRVMSFYLMLFPFIRPVFPVTWLSVCIDVDVKTATLDFREIKPRLIIYVCWFFSFIPNFCTVEVRSLHRVQWLISNNCQDQSWQFNTVLRFVAPCIQNVGSMFFWKVAQQFMATESFSVVHVHSF